MLIVMLARKSQEEKIFIISPIITSAREISLHPTMRGPGLNGGREGRGFTGCRRRRRRGQGHNFSSAKSASKKGLCKDLGNNAFDYIHKEEAVQMRKSWDKLVQHIGTKYGQDISNNLNNKTKVNIVTPVH